LFKGLQAYFSVEKHEVLVKKSSN